MKKPSIKLVITYVLPQLYELTKRALMELGNAEISETIRAMLLGFGMQIPELLAQRKFVSPGCHAHSNAHKPPTNFIKS